MWPYRAWRDTWPRDPVPPPGLGYAGTEPLIATVHISSVLLKHLQNYQEKFILVTSLKMLQPDWLIKCKYIGTKTKFLDALYETIQKK